MRDDKRGQTLSHSHQVVSGASVHFPSESNAKSAALLQGTAKSSPAALSRYWTVPGEVASVSDVWSWVLISVIAEFRIRVRFSRRRSRLAQPVFRTQKGVTFRPKIKEKLLPTTDTL